MLFGRATGYSRQLVSACSAAEPPAYVRGCLVGPLALKPDSCPVTDSELSASIKKRVAELRRLTAVTMSCRVPITKLCC
jgi:hypothetical protein